MERTHKVLARNRIDPGLPSDRAVNLRQQTGRHLHEPYTTPDDRGREPGQITNHSTTESHQQIVALGLFGNQPLNNVLQIFPVFGALTRFQNQMHFINPCGGKTILQSCKMKACHSFLGNDENLLAPEKWCDFRSCLPQQ